MTRTVLYQIWDIWSLQMSAAISIGPHLVNRVAFDPATSVAATASNNGVVRIYDIDQMKSSILSSHEDAVQMVIFDQNFEFLLSGCSDVAVKMWP